MPETVRLQLHVGQRAESNRPNLYRAVHVQEKVVAKGKGQTCSDQVRSLTKDKSFVCGEQNTVEVVNGEVSVDMVSRALWMR